MCRDGEKWSNKSVSCRICLSGKAPLISPCGCKGSQGLVHKRCLEKWLGFRATDYCELCNTKFALLREPKTFLNWVIEADQRNRCYLTVDCVCFLLLSPITVISLWLCCQGVLYHARSPWDSIALGSLIFLLVMSFTLWLGVCVEHHKAAYGRWRQHNFRVVLKELKVRPETRPAEGHSKKLDTKSSQSSQAEVIGNNSNPSRWLGSIPSPLSVTRFLVSPNPVPVQHV